MMRREPKPSALASEATGLVKRPRQRRSGPIVSKSVRSRAASAFARRSSSGESSTMDLGRLKRWTGNFRALTVIVPAALRGAPVPSTNPRRPHVLPGLASRSVPASAPPPPAPPPQERTADQPPPPDGKPAALRPRRKRDTEKTPRQGPKAGGGPG